MRIGDLIELSASADPLLQAHFGHVDEEIKKVIDTGHKIKQSEEAKKTPNGFETVLLYGPTPATMRKRIIRTDSSGVKSAWDEKVASLLE